MKILPSLLVLLLINLINSERIYEKIDNICQRCECVNQTDLFLLNCKQQNFHYLLENWPNYQTNQQRFIGIFTNNNLTTIERFPILTLNNIELLLNHCNIKYLIDGLFEAIPTIKLLDLSYNRLTNQQLTNNKFKGPYNGTIVQPLELEYLNLAYNQIHSLNQRLFQYLPKLKQLNLEGNDFVVLDLHTQLAISSIKSLQSLNLANNELTELTDDVINGLNLTELNLATNQLDFVPKSLRIIGVTLQILNISNNPIIDFNEDTFIGLKQLQILYANNLTKLKFVHANTFLMLTNLKRLHLSDNYELEAIAREAFQPKINQTLQELFINNNRLITIDYQLLNWTKLRHFEFFNNPLDCSCDLYNISRDLKNDIKQKRDGPMCYDLRKSDTVMVFDLQKDICIQPYQVIGTRYVTHHFTVLRISLMALSIVLLLAIFVAGSLGYTRFRKYHRNVNYTFVSQVMYNPISTATGAYNN